MAIFGVWMWPKSLRVDGAEAVVARCKRAGVTDIVFLTKGLAGTASYSSAIAPPECERDLLGELLDAAHKAGIRVHAWFTSASNIIYKDKHPESGRYHYIKGRNQGLISLADEGYIAYMAEITRELCRKYPIDGLHLDYIRYNHLIYGWSEEDQARYAAEGADLDHLRAMMDRAFKDEEGPEIFFEAYRQGDESVHSLVRTRRKDVVHFATTLTTIAREERPDLILSAALMPEGAYDDIAFSDVHYGQNYEDAAKLYDYALPMAYSQAYGKGGEWVRDVALGTMKRGMKTIVGVHAYEDWRFPDAFLLYTEEEMDDYNKFVDISTYVTNMRAQFITGTASLEKDWDTFVKNVEKMGIQDVMDVMTASYNRMYGE